VRSQKSISRLVIYPKDVQTVTGRSYSAAAQLISNIRKTLGKSKHQFITFKEFADFTGIDEETIKELLRD
jgi:hypothetical protein